MTRRLIGESRRLRKVLMTTAMALGCVMVGGCGDKVEAKNERPFVYAVLFDSSGNPGLYGCEEFSGKGGSSLTTLGTKYEAGNIEGRYTFSGAGGEPRRLDATKVGVVQKRVADVHKGTMAGSTLTSGLQPVGEYYINCGRVLYGEERPPLLNPDGKAYTWEEVTATSLVRLVTSDPETYQVASIAPKSTA